MEESIRQWYRKTTKKSMAWLIWAGVVSSIGAAFFYVLVPQAVHLKLQVFNGAITIPVAGGIWIVSFILLWLVPMRETAFRSQESMERMESRIEERLKKADVIIDRLGRITKAVEDGTHPLLNRIEADIHAIRERAEGSKPLEAPRRRDRNLPDPAGLDDVEKMEDEVHEDSTSEIK